MNDFQTPQQTHGFDVDGLLEDFYHPDNNLLDKLLPPLSLDRMDTIWKETDKPWSEDPALLEAIHYQSDGEDVTAEGLVEFLDGLEPNLANPNTFSYVEVISDGDRKPYDGMFEFWVCQKGDRLETYQVHEPVSELAATTDNSNPQETRIGRPPKRKITHSPSTPRKRRVNHTPAQIDALYDSHGWSRNVGCCRETVTRQTVCVRGEDKHHHRSWYKTLVSKRFRQHLLEYHGFDLCVALEACVDHNLVTGLSSVCNKLVCRHSIDCGTKFDNTQEGMYACIQHLCKEHEITHIISKKDL